MANVDRKGALPAKYHKGAPWNGAVNLYAVATNEGTAINIRDFVFLNGGVDANGVRAVSRALTTNSGALVGAVVGKIAAPPGNTLAGGSLQLDLPIYAPASAGVYNYLLVADDPDILFEMQCDETTALALASVGLNASLVVGTAATTGAASSTMELDTSSVAATSTFPLKIVEIIQRVDNELANAKQKVLVKINLHQYGNVIGTTGY
jgi:hypothetical protein